MPCLRAVEFLSVSFRFSFAQDAVISYKEILQMYWEKATSFVNAQCDGLEPWQLVGLTFSSTLLSVWLHGFLFQSESKYLKRGIFLCLGRGGAGSKGLLSCGGKEDETKPNTCSNRHSAVN